MYNIMFRRLIFGRGAIRKCLARDFLDFEIIYSAKVLRKSAPRNKNVVIKTQRIVDYRQRDPN